MQQHNYRNKILIQFKLVIFIIDFQVGLDNSNSNQKEWARFYNHYPQFSWVTLFFPLYWGNCDPVMQHINAYIRN